MTKVTRSSGNVFRDLGFEHEEADICGFGPRSWRSCGS